MFFKKSAQGDDILPNYTQLSGDYNKPSIKILIKPPIFCSSKNLLKVQGGFLVDPAPLDLRVLNSADFFLHVRAKVISGASGMSGTLDLQHGGKHPTIQNVPIDPSKNGPIFETLNVFDVEMGDVDSFWRWSFRYFFQWDTPLKTNECPLKKGLFQ